MNRPRLTGFALVGAFAVFGSCTGALLSSSRDGAARDMGRDTLNGSGDANMSGAETSSVSTDSSTHRQDAGVSDGVGADVVYGDDACSNCFADCVVDGMVVQHGESHVFYDTSLVPFAETCDAHSQSRTCTDGILSGDALYEELSCRRESANDCALGGVNIEHGDSYTFYDASLVPYGESCADHGQLRTCSNGVISGDSRYTKTTCQVAVAPKDCVLAGVTVRHSASRTFYRLAVAPYSEGCALHAQSRSCTDGVLSGSSGYREPACQRKTSGVFAVIGDSQAGYADKGQFVDDPVYEHIGRAGSVASLVKSFSPEFIVGVGDIYCLAAGDPLRVPATGDEAAQRQHLDDQVGKHYSDYVSPYRGIYGKGATDGINRFWNAIGNHEYYRTGARANYYDWYFSYPAKYYDIVKGDVHFFFLNSNFYPGYEVTSAKTQEQWLRNRVGASTSKWKVVVMHHPPHYLKVAPASQRFDERFAIDWQELGIDAILSGHHHHYERLIDDDGMLYFVIGSGGSWGNASSCRSSRLLYSSKACVDVDPTKSQNWGAQIVTASNSSLKFDFYDIRGVRRDSYTLTRHPAGGTSARYRDQKRIERLRQIAFTLRLEYADGSSYTQPEDIWCDSSIGATHYPAEVNCTGIPSSGSSWTAGTHWGDDSDLRDLETKGYLSKLPVDPINNKSYFLYYEPDVKSYYVCARRLETDLYGAQYRTEPYCISETDGNPSGY